MQKKIKIKQIIAKKVKNQQSQNKRFHLRNLVTLQKLKHQLLHQIKILMISSFSIK